MELPRSRGFTLLTSTSPPGGLADHAQHGSDFLHDFLTSPLPPPKFFFEKRTASWDDHVPELSDSRVTDTFCIRARQPSWCNAASPNNTRLLRCPDRDGADLQDNGEQVSVTIRTPGQAWNTLGSRFTVRSENPAPRPRRERIREIVMTVLLLFWGGPIARISVVQASTPD